MSGFIHAATWVRTPFLSEAEACSTLWVWHTLFTRSPVIGHLGGFLFGTVLSSAAWTDVHSGPSTSLLPAPLGHML